MQIDILSLFPEYFESPFKTSILRRAIQRKLVEIQLTNIRDFGEGRWHKVDDRPYGGGPGMVLMPGPVARAIRSVRSPSSHVVFLSPQGRILDAAACQRLSKMSHLIFLCGHYEGIDERVIASEVDEELSIGRYVLTNGCLASLVVIDAMVRFIPGVLGHEEGALLDSFQEGFFEGPTYTRPEEFEGVVVPQVLRSGHHAEIKQWRFERGMEKSKKFEGMSL